MRMQIVILRKLQMYKFVLILQFTYLGKILQIFVFVYIYIFFAHLLLNFIHF